jgi:ubiquinone/menaquinone biosynthesis C-methylase UbiE
MNVSFPKHIDWQAWIRRWDRMQDRYIPQRKERFDIITRLIADTQPKVSRILDVGCGTGSLMLPVLQAFPTAEVWGIDFDPMLLALAKKRLAKFGSRAKLIEADLRKQNLAQLIDRPFDAVVSATTLHWFSPPQLSRLYKQFGRILRAGGIFINADHACSTKKRVQKRWETHRNLLVRKYQVKGADDWDGFWGAYGRALEINIKDFRKKLMGPWVGSEQGLPLQWHFEKLKASGFGAIDCFWRLDCDAIYGGIRK